MSAVKALRLDCWQVKQAMQHPLLEGKKPFGRGVFSAVFDGTRANRVLKMTVDDIGYWLFNNASVAVRHRHFPRIFESHGEIGSTKINGKDYPIFLYEMERLEKLEKRSEQRRLASLVTSRRSKSAGKFFCYGDKQAIMELQGLMRDSLIPCSIRNALRQLEEFCGCVTGGSLDFHLGNFMQRKNGELVLIDPLANMKIWEQAQMQLYRRGW